MLEYIKELIFGKKLNIKSIIEESELNTVPVLYGPRLFYIAKIDSIIEVVPTLYADTYINWRAQFQIMKAINRSRITCSQIDYCKLVNMSEVDGVLYLGTL